MKFWIEAAWEMMITYVKNIQLNLIVEEYILLRQYTIKHDNHITLPATIHLRANTTHVFIFT
jgi:hypothetical protein